MALYETLANLLKGAFLNATSGLPALGQDWVRRRRVRIMLPADALASSANNYPLLEAEAPLRLIRVSLTPSADVTEDNTDFVTFDVNKEDGLGGGMTSLDSFNTTTTGAVTMDARVTRDFPGIVDTDTLTAGQLLILEITKDGAGQALPAMVCEVEYELL